MDKETRDTSAALSTLLEKEVQLSRKYEEYLHQEEGASAAKDVQPEAFLNRQTKFFDQLKMFLTAQQISLKQNLMLLETKTVKQGEAHGRQPDLENPSSSSKQYDDDLGKLQENLAMEALHQWGNPEDTKDENIQICPVCGLEFENNDTSDSALEDHVVSHWCSSEPI